MKKLLLVLISFCSKCAAPGQQSHQELFALEPTRCSVINGFPYLRSNQGAKEITLRVERSSICQNFRKGGFGSVS